MILDLQQIKYVIIKNPNRDLVIAGQEKCKELRMHMYGEGLEHHLKIINGFEKQWVRKLRVEYTRSNKDLFSRLGRPEDNVYSARGGSVYYNLPEAQERKAAALSADVRNGYSIKDWLENFWRPHYKDDPCGFLLMELLPEQEARRARREGRSMVYPTYQSIMHVYDYLPKGVLLEYVVFQLSNEEKEKEGYKEEDRVFRVIDDAYDYYVLREENDNIRVDWNKTIKNFFGRVPAIINSDIVDPTLYNSFNSIFDDAVELAQEFLMKGSIKVTSDFRHGFPKYAEFGDDCPTCAGEGFAAGNTCESCNGCGKVIRLRVTDDKILTYPADKETPVILPKDTGGYIEPSKNYYEIAISDMSMLENLMNLTLWGVTSKIKTNGLSINADGIPKTATEEMNEVKPQANRLTHISKSVEKRHKFILDLVIQINISATYSGSSVNYGRRYMLEGPDVLWTKYADARAKGVSQSALDDLLLAYYEAEYMSDPVKLMVQSKLMKVEPFIHFKAVEVLPFRLSEQDYKEKIYYSEWLKAQPAGILYARSAEQLRQSLTEYAASKQLEQPQPAAA